MQELWFLSSARCIMLIDIYMKFHEDNLNDFQVTEQTQFCDWQSSKGNNSKSINAAHRQMLIDIYMKFREDSLNAFQVIEKTWVWQTDARGKNCMSPNPKGGET